ncbi:MAG: DUF190 domain-containing protein [Anaerolineae bacterium]|nr:DUF190 domain-containing protein [Anaerolineae bacterium]
MATPAKRLTIYVDESDSWRGRSLYMSILDTLRSGRIAGATVTRAIAGFGTHHRIRTNTVEVLSMDLPIVITVVDTPENIERALALVKPMVREGLITIEPVEIVASSRRDLQPLPTYRPVSEIMTQQVTTVTVSTPAVQVVELLLGKLFKAVPVVDSNYRVVGIISDGDLLRKAGMPARLAVGERLEAQELKDFLARVSHEKTAEMIMTAPVVTVREDEPLGHVVQRMLDHGLKRMPVVDSWGKLVGMVSRLDILRTAADSVTRTPEHAPTPKAGHTIGELMSPRVPSVHVNDDLVDVLHRILETDIRRVIVLDERERPVGVITDGDLVARVNPVTRRNVLQALTARVMRTDIRRGDVTARDLMSEHVLAAPPETSVAEAISLMLREGRKRLVVVDAQEHPIGMVDRQTLMAASLQA